MPVILKIKNMKFYVYPKDHFPPHVHVVGKGWEVKLAISDQLVLKVNGKVKTSLIRELQGLIKLYQKVFIDAWHELEGEDHGDS